MRMTTNLFRVLLLLLTLTTFSSMAWSQRTTDPQGTETTVATEVAQSAPEPKLDTGDTAWMMVSSALVLMMCIPGLALFYAGMVRKKNVLSVLMQVFATACVLSLVWMVIGYSLAFGEGNAYVGDTSKAFLSSLTLDGLSGTIPESVFMMFQMTFFMITPALIVGAFVDRMKFSTMLVFMILWSVIVYAPIAHWVWASTGFLFGDGVLDFAGGTVVHINAGVAGLVCCLVLGKRIGYGNEPMAPHNLVLTLIGTSLLWVGWFGFNAGSALEANGYAGLAFINTFAATAAAVLAWSLGEALMKGKASMLGAASGAVAGLVAITPAAGNVGIVGALVIGLIAGFVCLWGVHGLKRLLGADDSLDVFGVHGVGGILGALLTGVFNSPNLGGPSLVGDWVTASMVAPDAYSIASQVWIQAKGVLITIVWSAVVSVVSYKIVDLVIGLRVPEDDEREGLDITSHGETAYAK